ncbi:hypothetical protein [Luteitalea sp.]|uniref:hypothetical protein n=1 Tax=Luteitalea sp. TaxID=2004800 RepID=UPI0025B906AC|nr:hypothetical protein [Luteitalea sp.]
MLAAYDGALPHPRSSTAVQDATGHFVAPGEAQEGLYRFNALGYRGPDLDLSAPLKVFVAGCSYTFGQGVPFEQTWPSLLTRALAERRGIPAGRASLQNFSQIGTSNEYITRTIIRQCERVRPDLAIIAFTHRERTEYLAPSVTRNIGLWDLDGDEARAAPALHHFDLFDSPSSSLELLKSMLLVQAAMKRRRIPYLILWMNRTGLDQPPVSEHPPLQRLRAMIDPARLTSRHLLEPGVHVDSNRDDRHPGPLSHANLAPLLLDALDQPASAATPAPPPSPPARRRVLVLGDFPSFAPDASDCPDGICRCREMAARHRLGEAIVERPLADQASNDRIARTLLEACHREPPDFVFLGFSARHGRELLHDGALVDLGLEARPPPGLARLTEAYRRMITDELEAANALRNILLAQDFLEARRIPYQLSIPPALRWRNMSASGTHPVLQTYAALVDATALCRRQPRDEGPVVPPPDDPSRRGPLESTRQLIARLRQRLGRSRSEDPNIYPIW